METAPSGKKDLKLHPPRRVTVVESIIEQMVALIGAGSLKTGDRLPTERQLMEMLGVSRATVREALQGLAAMGLVESRSGEGTFVTQRSPQLGPGMDFTALSSALQKEMRHHLNEARLRIELEIVSLAAERRTEENCVAIMAAVERYEESETTASDEQGWPHHDPIHLTIAQATQNPIFVMIMQAMLDMVPKALRHRGILTGDLKAIQQRLDIEIAIHRGICQAIVQGQAETACQHLREHAEHERQIIEEGY